MDFIDKCKTDIRWKRLYRQFRFDIPCLVVGDETEEIEAALNEMAYYFKKKVVSLDLQKDGEELFKGERIIVTEGVEHPYFYYELPVWAKEMQKNPEQQYLVVIKNLEHITPQTLNLIKRLADDRDFDEEKIGDFNVAVIYKRKSADEKLADAFGSEVLDVFKPCIEWDV